MAGGLFGAGSRELAAALSLDFSRLTDGKAHAYAIFSLSLHGPTLGAT